MSNPITPTVVETLLITDTGANALVVGGAIGATAGTGTVKAGTVNDSVGTMATIRAGGIGIASQAALDFIFASSATQLGRLVKGAALQYVRMNAAANAYEFGVPPMALIKEGTGTTTTVGAENVDTLALASSLTLKDSLYVVTVTANTGNAGTIGVSLYNSTDSTTISGLSSPLNNYYIDVTVIGAQSLTKVAAIATGTASSSVISTRSTFSTNYTGAWTLAFRQGGVVAGDSLQWAWRVYKLSGQ